ncbi:FixH family protein [Mesobacillus jeotgali]|uniref:FixH family protein n=1 Tax=Mesobacillus jeotgali TaxID=129985 RepID=UPI0009A7ADA2|nr:FixH family protein [Mesobacillus jeotgali]
MKKFLTVFIAIMFLLTACNTDQDRKESSLEDPPELLEVSIVVPEKIEINQEVTIKAHVSQGEEKVTNADEVKFEIWRSGQNDHEMTPAKNEQDGNYSIKKTFTEGGNYFIVAHTTANRMHSMPKIEIIVGGNELGSSHEEGSENEKNTEHEHNEHHNSEVSFDFTAPAVIKSKQQAELAVKIAQQEEIVSGARVRFEIWKEKETNHQFIEAEEISAGTYSTKYTFPEDGRFHIKIHVEKGNIHDHTEKSLDVDSN